MRSGNTVTSQQPDGFRDRIKCWQLMFLQTMHTFTFKLVIGPMYHNDNSTCHIMFSWHVQDLTVISEAGGDGGVR